MHKRIFYGMIAVAAAASAQTYQRHATIVGGGDPNNGKCTVEVVVDAVAEVEIRGADASLRNVAGQPAQWRRFECTSAMPANMTNFRFSGVDGRGKQELLRDPRNGGSAVIRIEDPEGGSEGYKFDVTWGGYGVTQDRGPGNGPNDFNRDRGPVVVEVPQNRNFDRDRDVSGPPNERGFARNPGGRLDPEAYRRERDAWFQGNNWRPMFFQRVREDLDHATSGAFPFNGDRARLSRTQMQLDDLQQKLSRGFFDQRQLDDVVVSMRLILQANRLDPLDRTILADDVNRLRRFSARHDEYGARDIEGTYHQDRDQRFRGNDWRATFFQGVREDLDHVAAFPFGQDQTRVTNAKIELDELQQKLSQGVYDQRELDDAIAAMQAIVQSNRLPVHDRDILTDDLRRMREFRTGHEQYGAR